MPFNPVGGFVRTKPFALNTGIAGILDGLRVNEGLGLSIVFFFDLLSNLTMKRGHDGLEDPVLTPVFVMPKDCGIRGKVFGEVYPVTTIFQLIENAI